MDHFRFSLRTLFVLMTIFGSLLGWSSMQLRWISERRESLRWIVDYRARSVARERAYPMPPAKGRYICHEGVMAPLSLAILGEAGVERLELDIAWLGSGDRYRVEDLELLFPEAKVLVTSMRRMAPRRGECRSRWKGVDRCLHFSGRLLGTL